MFSTFKKMIHKEKKDNKKPIMDLDKNLDKEPSREEYNIPEPDDINRLPLPGPRRDRSPLMETDSNFPSPVERQRNERIENFRRSRTGRNEEPTGRPMEPPPMRPLHESPGERARPSPRPSPKPMAPEPKPHEENISEEIIDRLESIEFRLSRIERAISSTKRTENKGY